MNTEKYYISKCKALIAEAFNLDNSNLIQRDFEFLRKTIFEKSGIDLSTATLRRIWANDGSIRPQTKTLEALAMVLGFEGWHHFKQSVPVAGDSSNRKAYKISRVGLIAIPLLLLSSLWFYSGSSAEEMSSVTLTSSTNVQEGVPATIGFNYDISSIKDQEVKIQLSWNPYEQTVLNPHESFYTGTYFYPDYHQVKLLRNDEVIASDNIHITTPGWHGIVMQSGMDPKPIYIDHSDFIFDDHLTISETINNDYNLHQIKQLYSVFTLSNDALASVMGDDFELDATIQVPGHLIKPICDRTDIVIKGVSGTMRVPISSNGCYGITSLTCSEVSLSGKNHDLSKLSSDLSSNVKINLTVLDQGLSIRVGDNETLDIPYLKPIGSLKVIKFIYTGYGKLLEFELKTEGRKFHHECMLPF